MPAYKDKERGTWYYQINYTDIDGKHKSIKKRGFETKRGAQEAEYLMRLEMNHSSSSKTELAFKDLCYHYFSFIETRLKYPSYYSKKNLSDLHILPYFQDKKINSITTKDIINWQHEMLKKNYSFEYLSKIYINLSAIFQHGVKHHGLKDNPCRTVGNFKNPSEVKENVNYWTLEEYKKFIAKIEDIGFYTFFMFLYYTGARKGEALALTWNEIDFDKEEINIFKSVAEKTKDGSGFEIGPPKTQSSIRRVSIPKILIDQLQLYYN